MKQIIITLEETREDGQLPAGRAKCEVLGGLSIFEVLGLLRYYHRKFETDTIIGHRQLEVEAAEAKPVREGK